MISNILTTNILTKIFGSRNERLLKQYGQVVRQINALEPAISALTDDELPGKTGTPRERVANGEELDSVLPEAFAIVREAGKRTLRTSLTGQTRNSAWITCATTWFSRPRSASSAGSTTRSSTRSTRS